MSDVCFGSKTVDLADSETDAVSHMEMTTKETVVVIVTTTDPTTTTVVETDLRENAFVTKKPDNAASVTDADSVMTEAHQAETILEDITITLIPQVETETTLLVDLTHASTGEILENAVSEITVDFPTLPEIKIKTAKL
eukprot:UN28376